MPGWLTTDRTISLVLFFSYIILFSSLYDPRTAGKISGIMLLGLLCIWIPDVLGEYVGRVNTARRITRATPSIIIYLFGWIILVVPLLLLLFGGISS